MLNTKNKPDEPSMILPHYQFSRYNSKHSSSHTSPHFLCSINSNFLLHLEMLVIRPNPTTESQSSCNKHHIIFIYMSDNLFCLAMITNNFLSPYNFNLPQQTQ